MDGYCFRCRAKKEMRDALESRLRNGKPCATGTCVTCGTKLFKILAESDLLSRKISDAPPRLPRHPDPDDAR
jgi:hypothetical protein